MIVVVVPGFLGVVMGVIVAVMMVGVGVIVGVSVVMVLRTVDGDVLSGDAAAKDSLGVDMDAIAEAESANGLVEALGGKTEVNEGPQGHVAADAAGAVEIGNCHGRASWVGELWGMGAAAAI
jgi:hypothetical protein